MKEIARAETATLYKLAPLPNTERYILTSRESRSICNDPLVFGVKYTQKLEKAAAHAFRLFSRANISLGDETHALILHILRGGLNFGIRDALFEAYGWSATSSAFVSSQRAFKDPEGWQVSEDSYRKMPRFQDADLIFGDVVATGVSLRHALSRLIELAHEADSSYRSITFVTIGGSEAESIIEDSAAKCTSLFPGFQGAKVIYIEGIFGVAQSDSPLSIAIPGTDLLRHPAELAPEFIESQKESLPYALERCTIYDAGSRAFDPREYLEDVRGYWQSVLKLAEGGVTLQTYLKERFPLDERLSQREFIEAQSKVDSLVGVTKVALEKIERALSLT